MNAADSSHFKTLSFEDSEFNSYLRGTFSKDLLALPVSTLNVRTQTEEVTFEVVSKNKVRKPGWFYILLKLLRPQTLSFSVGTMLVSYIVGTRLKLELDPKFSFLTIFAVLFFHAAINLLNDYYDHMKGHDRVNPRGGSRVIQLAWIRAYLVQAYGFGFLALSIAFGIPVLFLHSKIVMTLAALSALAGLEFSTHKLGLKNLGLGEYLVFFLTGPFLTCGFVWAISGHFQPEMIYLGCLFGFVTLFFYHASNIESIFADAQAGRKTWAVFVGIDRAKKILWLIAALIASSYFAFAINFDRANLMIYTLMFFIIATHISLICIKSSRTRSPLSGELESIRARSLRLHWLTVSCLIIATI